ncbi:hypothetical protein [Halalkalicoccus jeotgali]|uniref:Uncharacterized protein n=1 Tax=Halalkalicoccus jeotgali (strain DSM 18796 / CECT 7217 / JCM 14584 / KCTC 4019 / B3) TaxID=795797 RepID=D8J9P6_HALJB|nr:hypothetical protein [Halalkalicoccus jeotgali]ADJ14458.1 hypothetical protein HacjB3_05335 [Halalkalicoccus jeotgali B3]ELY40172.1 hypothetical protein C497_03710 [Halalkalicoccus jeotgali B3]
MPKIGEFLFGGESDYTLLQATAYDSDHLDANEEGTVVGGPQETGYIRTVPREEANLPYVIETVDGTYWLASSAREPLADWPNEDPWDRTAGNWRSDSDTMIKRPVSGQGRGGGWAFEMDLQNTSAFWTFPAYSLNPLPTVGERFAVWWRNMDWSSGQFWVYVCQQNETQANPETYRIEHRTGSGADMVLRRSDNSDVLDTVSSIPTVDGKWYLTDIDFQNDGPIIRTGDASQQFGYMAADESNPLPPNGIGFRGNPGGHYYIDVPEKIPPTTAFEWD